MKYRKKPVVIEAFRMESKTPRSIQHCDCGADKAHCFDCLFELSCQLENELAEAEKKVFVYKTALELAEAELIEARAEIERKDALIEQMREEIKNKALYGRLN